MTERPYEFATTPEGPVLRVRARGTSVLATPILNRGTAFTPEERRALGLVGLLPEGTSTIDGQVRRVYAQFQRQSDPLAKNVYLANLRDRNEVMFYRLLSEHLAECCRSSTRPRWARRSSATATSTAAPAGCSCQWTTPTWSRSRCATTASGPTTWTCSWPPTPRASSASATGA